MAKRVPSALRSLVSIATFTRTPPQRVRTLQRFDDTGRLACLYLMREERVLDAVTGAVDRYAPAYRRAPPTEAQPASP